MKRAVAGLLLLCAVSPRAPAVAQGFNWDALGTEFCRLTLAGDLAGMRTILTPELFAEVVQVSSRPDVMPPRVLFQTYTNEVPECRASTRNAALVEVARSNRGGGAPSWKDHLVVVPEPDGTTRIDDVLFATSRSDTLRARLDYYLATR